MREIRDHVDFSNISKVWPFETGFFAPDLGVSEPAIWHAEIWPGIVNHQLQDGLIRDQAQVRAMVAWAATRDAEGSLDQHFQRPAHLTEAELAQVIDEEGWILGTGID